MGFLSTRFYRWFYPTKLVVDPPEIQALLIASQRVLAIQQVESLKALFEGSFDWDRFIQLTLDHRVFPLVYSNLNRHLRENVPAPRLVTLQGHFVEALADNLNAKAELIRILDAFHAHDIQAMPVRGIVLAYLLYEGIWLREFKDIDILVEEANFPQAEALLLDMGYQRSAPIEDNAYNQKLYNVERRIEVELHWALDSPFVSIAKQHNFYWGQMITLALDGLEVKSLPLDALLMSLCFHGAKHRWSRLKWLCDVNEYCRKFYASDWNQILTTAQTLRIERIVLLNLYLVNRLFGTELPTVIRQAIQKDSAILALEDYARHWLFLQNETAFLDQLRGMACFYLHP